MTSVADAGSNADSHSSGETMEAVREIPESEKERPEAETIKASQDSENAELHQSSEPLNAPDEEFHRSEKLVDVRADSTTINTDEFHIRTGEVEHEEAEEISQKETLSSIEKPLELPREQHNIVESDNITADEGHNSTVIDASDMNSDSDKPDSAVECSGREELPNSSEPESQAGSSPLPDQIKHLEESNSTQAEVHPVTEGAERTVDAQDEEPQLSESQSVEIPLHWYPKPCLHVSSNEGSLTEEELLPVFGKYGPVSSVTFENERHDAVLIRYELLLEDAEEFLANVHEELNSTALGDKTLSVEPLRPDSVLFVGNLTSGIDDAALQEMFSAHGKIERAFVLRNAEGKSKCYGFVEYSLKTQAAAAKTAMGNTNMDGRVLRVEWSDCKKVADMFSSVLFIDRLPRDEPHIEATLRELFGSYGRIRDCHLAIGINNQYRGFAFIDFCNSIDADKAYQALDGYNFQGSSIRVSFANPSKSAQSYKFRYGSQSNQNYGGRGVPPGHGMVVRPSMRGPTSVPLMPPRFMGPGRPGMLGYGVGMQYGRGPYERGTMPPFHNNVGMPPLGPAGRASLMFGAMASRPGMSLGDHNRMHYGQAPMSITPSAIVQVATAQAKAREEEAKARAEAARQGLARSNYSSADQYQRFQPQPASYDQHYRQPDASHGYYQGYPHTMHQQGSFQQHHQSWNQQTTQQPPQNPRMHYNVQQHVTQNYSQQHQTDQNAQYSQSDPYYAQHAQQTQQAQHGYSTQIGQQQVYQYSQQATQPYGQVAQQPGQLYQQSAQVPQQNYNEQYVQQQQVQQQQYAQQQPAPTSQDTAQQQAYYAYYQQQATTNTTATAGVSQQSYEAQWAAYYASQAAYQQQTPSADVGQKRTADQMEQYTQNQASYNYAAYSQDGTAYQQQQANSAYQQTTPAASAVYQQPAAAVNPQSGAAYVAQPSGGQSGYEQPVLQATDVYQQPTAGTDGAAVPSQNGLYDYNKRPRY